MRKSPRWDLGIGSDGRLVKAPNPDATHPEATRVGRSSVPEKLSNYAEEYFEFGAEWITDSLGPEALKNALDAAVLGAKYCKMSGRENADKKLIISPAQIYVPGPGVDSPRPYEDHRDVLQVRWRFDHVELPKMTGKDGTLDVMYHHANAGIRAGDVCKMLVDKGMATMVLGTPHLPESFNTLVAVARIAEQFIRSGNHGGKAIPDARIALIPEGTDKFLLVLI